MRLLRSHGGDPPVASAQPFAAVNILPDPRIRQELSALSNWPTIPQLFVDGEFVGGCDIVTEMYESGELQEALGVEDASRRRAGQAARSRRRRSRRRSRSRTASRASPPRTAGRRPPRDQQRRVAEDAPLARARAVRVQPVVGRDRRDRGRSSGSEEIGVRSLPPRTAPTTARRQRDDEPTTTGCSPLAGGGASGPWMVTAIGPLAPRGSAAGTTTVRARSAVDPHAAAGP